MAAQFDIPFLGEVPLIRQIREGGDAGTPLVVTNPDHPQSRAFKEIAAEIMVQLEEEPQKQLPVH